MAFLTSFCAGTKESAASRLCPERSIRRDVSPGETAARYSRAFQWSKVHLLAGISAGNAAGRPGHWQGSSGPAIWIEIDRSGGLSLKIRQDAGNALSNSLLV
ncbi:MAG: hypothetical protein ABL998_04975 [Planctomycetota bacterium]